MDLALLQAELCKSGDGDIADFVDLECLLAKCLGTSHVVLPLEEGEGLVHERENIGRRLRFLDFDGSIELLDGILESLLIEKQFTAFEVKRKGIETPLMSVYGNRELFRNDQGK